MHCLLFILEAKTPEQFMGGPKIPAFSWQMKGWKAASHTHTVEVCKLWPLGRIWPAASFYKDHARRSKGLSRFQLTKNGILNKENFTGREKKSPQYKKVMYNYMGKL